MVPISPEIYSGAAVVMDNRSLFDYIQKIEDRRLKRQLAEQDAINDYLKNTSKDIDYKGIRTTDINNFQKKLNEFRGISDEFRKNPRDLNKRLELDRKADDLRLFVQKSKEAKEVDKEYANFLRQVNTNRELRKTTNLKRVMQDKAIHDLPIEFEGVQMLGIPARPDDTSPKLDYYKPAPVNTYDLVEKNLKGVNLGIATRVTPTDKDYYYTAEQKYTPEGIKTVSERIKKQISSDPDLIASYEVKGQQLDPKTQAEYTIALKKYYPDMEVDEEDGVSVGLAEAILDMEGRKKITQPFDKAAYDKDKSERIESRQRRLKAEGEATQETIGNAFDSIDEIQGVYPDIKISKGKGTIAGIEYTGTVSTKGNKLPELVKAPLRAIGYDIKNNEDVDIKVENGQIVSIKPKDRSAVDREAMRNAQLKFSTEPQKGPQMRFAEKEKEGVKTTSKKTGASGL